MLLLDSEAISSVAHGPDRRRIRVRALVMEMRARDLPIATVAAVIASCDPDDLRRLASAATHVRVADLDR